MIRRGIGVQSFVSAGGGTDADAQAFITAAGITDATQQSAINTLVTDLKGYGIWSKMKAIWPMVGGTASTHKWNLKDPRDLDAAFRLVFSGGITHASTGWQPNGVNGYGDTKLNTFNNLIKTSAHLSIYVRNNSKNGSPYDMANAGDDFMTSNPTYLITRYSNDLAYIGIADSSYGTSIASTNSVGYWAGSTNGGSTQKLYKNGSSITSGTAGSGNLENNNLYIGAANAGGTALFFADKEYAFASIGDGLTDTEAANLYTAVQAYQTTLSRNV